MGRWTRWSGWWARPVVDGKVRCELRGGEADLAECEGCSWLLEVDLLTEQPRVLCRPDAAWTVARSSGI